MIHLSNTSSSCNCLTAFHTPRNGWLTGLLFTTSRISPGDFPICSQLSHTVIFRLFLTVTAQGKVWKSYINRQHLYKTVNRFQGQLDPNISPATTCTRCWSSLFLLPATATLDSDTTTDNKVGEKPGYKLAKTFPYLI